MQEQGREISEEINELVNKIKNGEIKPCKVNPGMGLPCLKCLAENSEYDEPTKNPIILSYQKNGYWYTVYFHEDCFEELQSQML